MSQYPLIPGHEIVGTVAAVGGHVQHLEVGQSVGASPLGSPATIREMLRFAARHGIAPQTEDFRLDEVNEAMDHLRSGNPRYRIVLDMA
jgi:uncharacterized zinc-type alcohol dehydrogenase-like protein